MIGSDPPTFDQWVHYCFTGGRSGFTVHYDDPFEEAGALDAWICGIDGVLLTEYLTRLFESPQIIDERYSDDQIEHGISFIFGSESGFLFDVRTKKIPEALQIRCIRSIAVLYTDLFDQICGQRGMRPDIDLRDTDEIDGRVYMIWDMDNIEGTLLFPDVAPHLVEPAIEVLDTALNRCRTSACRVSALHGIGHVICTSDTGMRASIATRLRSMVDEFLATKHPPEWLSEYAGLARQGYVQ